MAFTYSDYVKRTLRDIRKNGFDFQIEELDYECCRDDYYAVYDITPQIGSKEFCFRVKKLIEFSSKEHYTILKTTPFFKTIYKENKTVKKELINIIPDFQKSSELIEYLLQQKEKNIAEKKELIRKKNANLDNVDYSKRKDKQIGYFTKIIADYDRLLAWCDKI